MPARSLSEWARAEPSTRDAVLALADQAVALQPAAEAVIQFARLEAESTPDQIEEARRVERGYQALVDQLHAVEPDPVVGDPLESLLGRHLDLLHGAMRDPSPPEGLGRVAGELVGLRDRVRRTAGLRGRIVADVPGL
jgi:hypothetical protein